MNHEQTTDYGNGIVTINTGFERDHFAASHLLVEGDRAAFIDVGTNFSAPNLLETLDHYQISKEQVDYVIVTHVHLDHAGGAGLLMQQLPNAKLVVHPRGARHMVDPSRLVAGATAVYGEKAMLANYGSLQPVDSGRIIEAPDGFTLELNGRELLFLDTPGHARHHFCVYDKKSNGFFTGDTFGISYRELDSENGAYILASTTPVQFDPEASHHSIDRLMEFNPSHMYLTHYGQVGDTKRLAEDLHRSLEMQVAIARKYEKMGEQRIALMAQDIMQQCLAGIRNHGCDLAESECQRVLDLDVRVNAQGLDIWLQQQATAGE